jgi:hypothetical protein
MGETMAQLSHGETLPLRHARSLEVGIAGSESNVVIAAARLGVRAAWIGRVGDDEFGRLVTRELNAEGVGAFAGIDRGGPTALMLKASRSSQFHWDARSDGVVEPTSIWHVRHPTATLASPLSSASPGRCDTTVG